MIWAFLLLLGTIGLLWRYSLRNAWRRVAELHQELDGQAERLQGWIDAAEEQRRRGDRAQEELEQVRRRWQETLRQASFIDATALGVQQELADLQQRWATLVAAVRKHRDAQGHERCWLNDRELYAVLGDKSTVNGQLPCLPEFMRECAHYWQTRQPTVEEAKA